MSLLAIDRSTSTVSPSTTRTADDEVRKNTCAGLGFADDGEGDGIVVDGGAMGDDEARVDASTIGSMFMAIDFLSLNRQCAMRSQYSLLDEQSRSRYQ